MARQDDKPTQVPAAVPSVPAPASTGSSMASPASAPPAPSNPGSAPAASKPASAPPVQERGAMLAEGEKRFGTNCGRCHQSPHHFAPRMMATVVRHMRVRATITDEDMRLILLYLTQ